MRSVNKYFDEEQPWITVKSDIEKCKETLNTCVQIILLPTSTTFSLRASDAVIELQLNVNRTNSSSS
ncbi:MAG: hypothetical protein ACOX7R_09010 [Acetivibrionales bacterium]